MPQSALEQLSRLHILYPMMFMIGDEKKARSTHCGVLEFCAPEGIVYVPGWMMKALNIKAGSLITMMNTSLPLGKYVKIQPQSADFLGHHRSTCRPRTHPQTIHDVDPE